MGENVPGKQKFACLFVKKTVWKCYRMLSWRKVQAGVPPPFKGAAGFSEPGTVRVVPQGHSCLPYPLGWKTRDLESLQLFRAPLCLPSWPGRKGSLLTCGVPEGPFLPICPPGELHCPACSGSGCHRRAVGSGNFTRTSPGGKALEAQGSESFS